MFGLKSKQNTDEVLNHWIASADNFSHSPEEFYQIVEQQLQAIEVPDLEISRKEYAEGGLLSSNRVYLRLIRERLAFDVCAASFGTRYFFSCRSVYAPVYVRLTDIILVLVYLGFIGYGLYPMLGPVYCGVAIAAIILTTCIMFKSVVAKGIGNVDAALIKFPGVGPFYEQFFRKETYYRHDTRLMYLDTIPAVVQAVADEITAAKGVKLVRIYQTAPILGDLYKPVPPRQQPELEN